MNVGRKNGIIFVQMNGTMCFFFGDDLYRTQLTIAACGVRDLYVHIIF